MGRVDGKVALVTGAARGQGRSHALRLASEGAAIVAVDICRPIGGLPYETSTPEDLKETARLVEAAGGRIITREADVRDFDALAEAVAAGEEAFGTVDVGVMNAGIFAMTPALEITDDGWRTMLEVNLMGAWHGAKAVASRLVAAGAPGSLIFTSSTTGLQAAGLTAHYGASKHGVIGLARTLAIELGPSSIRCNVIAPTGVNTTMILHDTLYKAFNPDMENPTFEDARPLLMQHHMLPIAHIEPQDVSQAVLWLASDESRFVTAAVIPVDGGFTQV